MNFLTKTIIGKIVPCAIYDWSKLFNERCLVIKSIIYFYIFDFSNKLYMRPNLMHLNYLALQVDGKLFNIGCINKITAYGRQPCCGKLVFIISTSYAKIGCFSKKLLVRKIYRKSLSAD